MFSFEWVNHQVEITPEAEVLETVFVSLTLANPLVVTLRLLFAYAPLTRTWTIPRRVFLILGHFTLQGAVTVALLWFIFVFCFLRLFNDTYSGIKKTSPDGKKVAYLYKWGLFCGYSVFVRPRLHLTLRKAYQIGRKCDLDERPQLMWNAKSTQVYVVDGAGNPMLDNSAL